MKQYYYFITTQTCVGCGHEITYKERIYGVKPKDYNDTHKFEDYACNEHFI